MYHEVLIKIHWMKYFYKCCGQILLERKINRELSMGKPVAEFERVALKESEWKPKKDKGKMW